MFATTTRKHVLSSINLSRNATLNSKNNLENLTLICNTILSRKISTSKTNLWDEVRSQTHAANSTCTNPYLKNPRTVSIIGAPLTYGQPLLGTDAGPQMLRDAGIRNQVTSLKWLVEETGDIIFDSPSSNDPVLAPSKGKANQCFAVGQALKKLHDRIHMKAEEGKFCLTLGGDHSIGAGSISGLLSVRPDTGVIWVDAHADINTPQVSSSGNMHGMPLSFVLKGLTDPKAVPGFEWMADLPKLEHNQLVYIGLRDIDPSERKILQSSAIKAYTMQDVDRYGIGKLMEMALDHLNGKQQRPLHMSYDIDAVDPGIAPSTGTTVRGGLSWREALYVAEAVAESNCLCSLDMVEVNPSLSPGKGAAITVEMALLLIESSLGNRIL